MGQLHNITIRLVDARLATLLRLLGGDADICPQLGNCVHLQRELKRLLISGEVSPNYAEGLILFNNCQDIAEALLERDMLREAQEVFETECLVLSHSRLAKDDPYRIATRLAEHVIRLFLCLPPASVAERFRPFIEAAMNCLGDPTSFSEALTLAMEKLMNAGNSTENH